MEKLIQEDRLSAMLEKLEANCNLVLEQLTELGKKRYADEILFSVCNSVEVCTFSDLETYSPLLEAVTALIVVGPHTEIKGRAFTG